MWPLEISECNYNLKHSTGRVTYAVVSELAWKTAKCPWIPVGCLARISREGFEYLAKFQALCTLRSNSSASDILAYMIHVHSVGLHKLNVGLQTFWILEETAFYRRFLREFSDAENAHGQHPSVTASDFWEQWTKLWNGSAGVTPISHTRPWGVVLHLSR